VLGLDDRPQARPHFVVGEGLAGPAVAPQSFTPPEVARLYAQQFPYQSPPAAADSVILDPAGPTAAYAFQVTPAIATRYKVELFRNSTATTPLAVSSTSTIYVALAGSTGKAQTCGRPVCHERFRIRVRVPARALSTEIAKQWYPYFGLNLGPSKVPPAPKRFRLGAGHPHVTPSRRVSATELEVTVTFSFRVDNNAYDWNWNVCSRDTEAQDGIGLPGHHGCGDKHASASARYTG
jgi:hypothetical protein